jgi:hypothetical protein
MAGRLAELYGGLRAAHAARAGALPHSAA